ncbi:MAG: divalent metal cation transporter [Chitinophagales bacterium]
MSDSGKSASFFLRFWKRLGPGLITGASDDDPSGITTYTQAGAQFGFGTLWTALLTFPLMAAIQEMCARIGLVTRRGLTGTLKTYYPKPVLVIMVLFSAPAIVMNIGADIAGMGAVGNLLFPEIKAGFFSVGFTLMLILAMVYLPYRQIATVLKYLCLTLLVYLAVPFFTRPDALAVLQNTFIPHWQFTPQYINMLVAVLGTTISPYLFFWQTNMEVEELEHNPTIVVDKRLLQSVRSDVDSGMLFSIVVMYFITLTAGSVLYQGGGASIETVEQAARALEPVAGRSAYLLFAIGVIGTGLLAIPVLSGSLSYIVCELFDWREGLDNQFHEARPFYAVMAISMILGLSMESLGLSPVKALIYAAVLYGVTAPVLIAIVLHIANNKRIMGAYTNGRWSNAMGVATLVLMTLSALALLYFQFH